MSTCGYARRKVESCCLMNSTSSRHEERENSSNDRVQILARNHTCMTMLVVALALDTFAQSAIAREPDCRVIESTSRRLEVTT
jgi:hypothetical protein